MATGWSATDIEAMKQEHKDLVNYHCRKPALCYTISSVRDGIDFTKAWSVVKVNFQDLHHFIGGLASVFQRTSQLEGDFSI